MKTGRTHEAFSCMQPWTRVLKEAHKTTVTVPQEEEGGEKKSQSMREKEDKAKEKKVEMRGKDG